MNFGVAMLDQLFNAALYEAMCLETAMENDRPLDKKVSDSLVSLVEDLRKCADETFLCGGLASYSTSGDVGMMFYEVNSATKNERTNFACLSCTPEQARKFFKTFASCCEYFSLHDVFHLFDIYFNLEQACAEED